MNLQESIEVLPTERELMYNRRACGLMGSRGQHVNSGSYMTQLCLLDLADGLMNDGHGLDI